MAAGRMGKSELVTALWEMQDDDGLSKGEIKTVLDDIAQLAKEEIEAGNDFEIPNVCKVVYRYTKPKQKGKEYPGFGGTMVKAEKNVPAKIRIAATAHGKLKQLLPKLNSKAGKAVAARKG